MEFLKQIDKWADYTPNKVAFINGDEKLTYQQLKEKSDILATWLLEELPNDNTPIIVYGHLEKEMLICFIACAKSGHAYIPIDYSTPNIRIKEIMKTSESSLVLSIKSFSFTVCNEVRVVGINEINGIFEKVGKNNSISTVLNENDNIYVMFTSGSTGVPKGVQITYKSLNNFILWAKREFKILNNNEIFFNHAPFSFDLSVLPLYLSLFSGGTFITINKVDIYKPRKLIKLINENCVSIWVSTPTFAKLIFMDLNMLNLIPQQLKKFIFCGEVLTKQLASKLLDKNSDTIIFNAYGPTEATVAISSAIVTKEMISANASLPIGTIGKDSNIIIFDSNNKLIKNDDIGELIIKGETLSSGYLKNETENKMKFFDFEGHKVFRTGDLGYIKNNHLYYSGRIDYQVKIHGYRIELEEIEKTLKLYPIVDNAVVLPIMDDFVCRYLVCFLCLKQQFRSKYSTEDIKEILSSILPEYMVPRFVIFKQKLPMNINGKIDKKQLLDEVNEYEHSLGFSFN